MSIISSDLLVFASTGTNSSGGTISGIQIVDANINNLFPDVTGDQAAAGLTLYAKIFFLNNNATLTLNNALVCISSIPFSQETIALALGTSSDSNPLNPALVYSTPVTVAAALALDNVGPSDSVGVWIQKVTQPGATVFPASNVQLTLQGQTL